MKVFGRRDLQLLAAEAQSLPPAPAAPEAAAPAPDASEPKLRALRLRVLKQIDPVLAADLQRHELRRQVEGIIHEIANEERLELSAREQVRLAEELANDMTGFGPLEALLRRRQRHRHHGQRPEQRVTSSGAASCERADIRFRDAEHIAGIAQKIAARIGRRIDESSPMVDARLPDGSRVNVVFPPLALDSPCISIRKFSRRRARSRRPGAATAR